MSKPLNRLQLLLSAACSLFSVLILVVAQPCVAESFEQKGDKRNREKPYALIFGTVWGPDNQPVYGVKIKCRRATEKKARWEGVSDHNGEVAFRVPAGKADYLVSADLKGYKSLDRKHFQAPPDVNVHIENDERTDIGVHLK